MDRTQGQPDQGERQAGRPLATTRAEAPAGPPAGHAGDRPPAAPGPLRMVTLTAGEFTLTVNPLDGSEIEPLRPGTERAADRPAKRDAAARAEREALAGPPALPGAPLPARPPRSRTDEEERLVRLLGRGRSVRLTGPSGSGRSTLLGAVAGACAGLAPDGVVRISGHGMHQPTDVLHALYTAVYDCAERRPDRTRLLARVRDIGAIVLLDDLELGGPALDELLRATPECAFLLVAGPDTKPPADDTRLDEVFLGGLDLAECLLLLETATGRALTDAEQAWAADLRFASEGLPLRFVQAAALLRQRDELNRIAEPDDDEEPGVFEERPRDVGPVPLPTLAEAAAPAVLLASRVSESARAALRIACALGGELPHHAHLPALVGDTHADAAVAELLGCGLITPVGSRHRLAEGVARQLEEAGYGETAAEEARTAARHYAWWTGHASVTPERVAAEADAVLAALAGADVVAAVLLARTAAPALAASLHWEAWERALRAGAEAARKAGEVAEQAYFHHELGVLALCEGRLDRARAELEASIGLRGALADKRGTVAGRRALALVTDREALGVEVSPPLRLEAPVSMTKPAKPGAPASSAQPGTPARPGSSAQAGTSAQPWPSAQAGTPGKSGAAGAAGHTAVPALSAPPALPALPAAPVSASASAAASAAPVSPVAPRSEAVTQVNPLIAAAVPPTAHATTLSQVFEDAFPNLPETPAPVPAPAPHHPAPEPAGRRRTVLMAAAGALSVVALGTVVGLSVASGDAETPKSPPAASTPPPDTADTPQVPQVPGGSGNDPAPDPAAPSADAPAGPSAGPSADPGAGRASRPTGPAGPGPTSGPQRPPATRPAPPGPGSPKPPAPVTSPPASTSPQPPTTVPPVTPPVTGPTTPDTGTPSTSAAASRPAASSSPSSASSASSPTI
ncbi:ATP-binding protein [Streptomyces sp. NPDC048606]|uniref:ATP-binding protein n=1 Tax=Streptomyces sp. NPDC048606 TaxID=3154726 RepID=UPI00341CED22